MKISDAVALFRFDDSWIGTGFLDEEFCASLRERWNVGDDQNTEHYRNSAFRRILHTRSELGDKEFLDYIMLCRSELSSALHASPMIDLVKWRGLSSSQFTSIGKMLQEWPPSVRNAFERRTGEFVPAKEDMA